MPAINSINATDTTLYTDGVKGTSSTTKAGSTSETLPTATSLDPILNDLDLPDLPLSMRGVSIDSLLSAISDESRRNGIQAAVDSIETQGEYMESENAKKLEEIKKQLDELKNQSFWQKFCKVFQVIGAVLGAVASVASTVVGFATGNPLLAAAGIMGAIASIDSIVSVASDGKYSIAAGVTAAFKAMGVSEDVAQWIGMGVSLGLTVTTVALSFGGAAAASGTEVASKLLSAGTKIATGANIASGVTGVVQGAGSIALTVSNYKVAMSKAKQVDLDAVLEMIRANIKMNQDLIEEEMKTADNLISAVQDIVDDCAQTATALLTASPATA